MNSATITWLWITALEVALLIYFVVTDQSGYAFFAGLSIFGTLLVIGKSESELMEDAFHTTSDTTQKSKEKVHPQVSKPARDACCPQTRRR
jgi:hypothetical protein